VVCFGAACFGAVCFGAVFFGAGGTVNVDVLVVGAGPAGLSAAVELRPLGAGAVLVLDREEAPGGIPRHRTRSR
jgi:cation diffusion facilitator CzcD-associated flavoprotein CzcO